MKSYRFEADGDDVQYLTQLLTEARNEAPPYRLPFLDQILDALAEGGSDED